MACRTLRFFYIAADGADKERAGLSLPNYPTCWLTIHSSNHPACTSLLATSANFTICVNPLMNSPSADDGVTIALTLTTTSSTLSLSSSHSLELFVCARIIQSTCPRRSVTIAADRSVFAGEGLKIGVFGPGAVSRQDPSRVINFGIIRPRYRDDFEGPSLSERGYRFLTIPADGTGIVVPYGISFDRLFKHSTLRPEDIIPGEEFEIKVNNNRCEVLWWCWGDVEGDLKGKNLHTWSQGGNYLCSFDERPSEEEIGEGNYVLGGDVDKFEVEDQTGSLTMKMIP
ncbi:hypothetical protein BO83DRAFT_418642 [Aspergillus eucalypticola CBS 122712]|uniref:Uncharacterized protein n=1 Tax=Aspergillus eucalypticola (strain CBS 122712 / IBT 29274) TaxID=1448314 RepID=A0A317V371_ASPEC|nr:uncharacterized protein BO83DRAFT_418642 [Aspergillus eucalypticola CBS 122712]PWY68714.1 hypothetical protein BO83DRAFT_418642 [Aspergillus eucalypticola CBS 122712]